MNEIIESVKREVVAAFSKLGPPPAAQLIGSMTRLMGPIETNTSSALEFQQQLAGKDWISLNESFLTQRWSSFCYLSAEAYRYYLPALLISCLNNFSKDNDLVHSTVFRLTPHYWKLYKYGRDDHFEYQTSRFSAEQYGAVCSFLGLVFDLLPNHRFQGAKALRWGWNKQESVGLTKCLEFYRHLHDFQYPSPSDPQIRELAEHIERAFEATPYPGDDRICRTGGGREEPAEYALEFRGLDWKKIHPDFLAQHHAALSFFTGEGFRYYLPAYLIADLRRANSDANPVFHLTYGSVWNVDDFSHFEMDERKAIVAYLKYSSEDEYSKDDINAALQRYWLKMPV
jgi:hypothetical protein